MILDFLYSRRHKKENNLFPDVFTYDQMAEKLKITLYKVFNNGLEQCAKRQAYPNNNINHFYEFIHDSICEEHSFHYLENNYASYQDRVLTFFNSNSDLLIDLDILNLVLQIINITSKEYDGAKLKEYIHIINQRMLEHGFGYQYEDGLLIRIDSQHTHAEIIKPALSLLRDKRFEHADEEFRQAFEAYKSSDFENAIVKANNSFETTMKIICNLQGYGLPKKHNATALIEHLRLQNFVPDFHIEVFKKLASSLDSISVIRNNVAGHGQGHEKRVIEESMVSYVLNMTASTIKMLVELNNAK